MNLSEIKQSPDDITHLLSSLRIRQWGKNLFILSPLLFSGRLLENGLCLITLATVFAFCLLSGMVYIFNDLSDLESDKAHPKKSNRALASGKLPPVMARNFGLFLLAAGLILSLEINVHVFLMALAYAALNFIYNIFTRKFAIIDVISIALGFHIRIWAGALAIGISPSAWLQACTFTLALFLGFTKRRCEIAALTDRANKHRQGLDYYSVNLLDQIIIICSTLVIGFYIAYCLCANTISAHKQQNMLYSTAFVVYGIFRYLYLIHAKKSNDEPGAIIFNDLPIMICILLWVGWIFLTLYVKL